MTQISCCSLRDLADVKILLRCYFVPNFGLQALLLDGVKFYSERRHSGSTDTRLSIWNTVFNLTGWDGRSRLVGINVMQSIYDKRQTSICLSDIIYPSAKFVLEMDIQLYLLPIVVWQFQQLHVYQTNNQWPMRSMCACVFKSRTSFLLIFLTRSTAW